MVKNGVKESKVFQKKGGSMLSRESLYDKNNSDCAYSTIDRAVDGAVIFNDRSIINILGGMVSFRNFSLILAILVFCFYTGLILSLFYFWRGEVFLQTLLSERTLFSIKISLISATVATVLALLIAIPASYALSRFEFRGKNIVDTVMELPLVVSPAALGAMILIFFNNPLGSWIQENAIEFVFTFYGIILAQFVTVVGVAVRFVKIAMDSITNRYELVAYSLGVKPWKTFFKVIIPLSFRGILAAGIISWAKAIGEFGATITIAGSMAMKTETLPLSIFMQIATSNIEGSVALIVVLLLISFSTLYLLRLLGRRLNYE